jgi:hypothetical protein
MKRIITLSALAWATLASAQTADQFIAAGTNDLAVNNWWGAQTNFAAAVAASPTNETANALEAAMRLLVLPQTPAGSNFLVVLGFPKTNLWLPHIPEGDLPKDANGYPIFPANYNSTNISYFFKTNVMPAIDASLTNLAAITHANFTLMLSSNETSIDSVTVDYGDVQLLRAELWAVKFLGYSLNENNFSTVMPQIDNWFETDSFSWQLALATYPNILTLQSPGDLASSKNALTNAIAFYFAASDFIRNRPADATNRLFELVTNDISAEAKFRTELTNVLLSLNGPTEFNTNDYTSTLNLAAWFSGTNSLNKFLPKFNGDLYVNNSLPDYTFGGILPYEPAYRTEKLLRNKWPWPSYAGIYAGQVYDLTYGDPSAGYFAVFIGTNQQATVVGYDVDSFDYINGDQAGGVWAQFPIDQNGNWEFDSNVVAGVSGYGWTGKDGSFGGELDFTNGDSVQLDGFQPSLQTPLGPFQDAAGSYRGTWSGTFGGQPQSGTLSAVLSADGYFLFCVFNHGTENDGGLGQFDPANQFFTTTDTASGSTVSGTLNASTLTITGTSSNPYGSASWTVSRAGNAPFDVPPVITANPVANTNIALGTTVTFFLTATGSPPLCYQWYLNGDAIAYANGNTLVVSNNLWAAAGNYSISATVDNVAGETNAFTAVSVGTTNVELTLSSLQPLTSSGFSFSLQAGVGVNGHIDVSTNLLDWTPLTNFTGNGGVIRILDPGATNSTDRFYRATVP